MLGTFAILKLSFSALDALNDGMGRSGAEGGIGKTPKIFSNAAFS